MNNAIAFTHDDAKAVAARIGLDFATAEFDVDQFTMGLGVELEHGAEDPRTNVTNNDPELTGKIAWAHLNEFPDYYTRLHAMEADAHAYWEGRTRKRRLMRDGASPAQ